MSEEPETIRQIMMPVPENEAVMQVVMQYMRTQTGLMEGMLKKQNSSDAKLNKIDKRLSSIESANHAVEIASLKAEIEILKNEKIERDGAKKFVEWIVRVAIPIVTAFVAFLGFRALDK